MNCPVKFQLDYVMEFKAYRAASKIPPNKLIDTAVNIKIKQLYNQGLLPEDALDEDQVAANEYER